MTASTKSAAKKLSKPAKKSTAPAATKKEAEAKPASTGASLSASDMAAAVGTDPRTLRKFLRASSHFEACGQGKRYTFTKKDVASVKKHFAAWRKETERASANKKAEKEAKASKDVTAEVIVEDDTELDLETDE